MCYVVPNVGVRWIYLLCHNDVIFFSDAYRWLVVCLSQQLRIGCFKKPWLQKWTSSRGTFSLLCHIVPSSRSHLFLSNYRGIVRRNSFWDYLIFNKVQKSLGGRVRFILTGSAPISEKVLNFLRCAFGCMVSIVHTHTHSSYMYMTLVGVHKIHIYGKSENSYCKNIFVVDGGYEN